MEMKINEENIFKLDKSFNNDNDENKHHIGLTVSKRCLNKNINKSNKINKIELVKECIKDNYNGCDITLCLFFSALYSYRTDRCLRPFPTLYLNDGNKDLNKLREDCDSIPSLNELIINTGKYSKNTFNLLYWLFLEKGQPVLKKIDFDQLPTTININNTLKPNYIYEVNYTKRLENIWKTRRGNKNIILAFHGSQIDNFYSILKVGLQQRFTSERVLFGDGIYLTNELTLSTNYAPFGHTWKNSIHGNKHSVIAVCEIINDTERVKCKDVSCKGRATLGDSFYDIPDKYFVVTDSDMVRVKYLLVYRSKTMSSLKMYMCNNILYTFIILYVLLLLFIGFFNSPNLKKYYNQFNKMFY